MGHHAMKMTLVILAAGVGRRYGGLKQLEPVGPDGSALMDYGVYDAIRAGFGKVVFVVRAETQELLHAHAEERFNRHVSVHYAVQEMEVGLADPTVAKRRTKPWGTGQAVLAAADTVGEPFAVINADDFYGAGAFTKLATFLRETPQLDPMTYAMVGYRLRNTLSESGTVSRGVCRCTPDGWLDQIVETTKIAKDNGGAVYVDETGAERRFSGDETVSMNTWGFSPTVFEFLQQKFERFLKNVNRVDEDEFYLPSTIQDAMQQGQVRVKVLPSTDAWCGVTYPDDKPHVVRRIGALVKRGDYPERLWG